MEWEQGGKHSVIATKLAQGAVDTDFQFGSKVQGTLKEGDFVAKSLPQVSHPIWSTTLQ